MPLVANENDSDEKNKSDDEGAEKKNSALEGPACCQYSIADGIVMRVLDFFMHVAIQRTKNLNQSQSATSVTTIKA